jgi:hypothetical protein
MANLPEHPDNDAKLQALLADAMARRAASDDPDIPVVVISEDTLLEAKTLLLAEAGALFRKIYAVAGSNFAIAVLASLTGELMLMQRRNGGAAKILASLNDAVRRYYRGKLASKGGPLGQVKIRQRQMDRMSELSKMVGALCLEEGPDVGAEFVIDMLVLLSRLSSDPRRLVDLIAARAHEDNAEMAAQGSMTNLPNVPKSEQEFLHDIEVMTDWPDDLTDPTVRDAAIRHLPTDEHFWPNNVYSAIGLLRIGVERGEAVRDRDHEKMIITCDNLLQALQGKKKSSEVSEDIARGEIDRQRRVYGVTRKSW